MEKLPALGTAIHQVVQPTFQIYAPLLLKQEHKIKSTTCSTYTYGPHPRQQLDVYTPSASAKPLSENSKSVLIFLYGGGFVRGDKSSKDLLNGLVYANLGHYFAESLGCEVVIPDYRLISHGASYPSGGEDLRLAVDWVVDHIGSQSKLHLDLFLMGDSAGGVHVATFLLDWKFASTRRRILTGESGAAKLKAAVLLSVPLHFGQANPDRNEVLSAYFKDKIEERCPLGLLKAAKQNGSFDELRQVSFLILTGSLDPEDEILLPNQDFISEWSRDGANPSNLTVQEMQGHNHISPVLAVSTGKAVEEAWATSLLLFLSASSSK